MKNIIKNINFKKTPFSIVSIILIAAVTFISAFAILSSSSDKTNKFTASSQSIVITEDKFTISSNDTISPNEPFDKNPTIINKGNTDCFVRAYLGFSDTKFGKENLNINIGSEWFLAEDGYYYYPTAIAPNESVEFFNQVTVKGTNQFDCDIFVYAESIDANHNDYKTAWNSFNVTPAETETQYANIIIDVLDLDNSIIETFEFTVEAGTELSKNFLWDYVEEKGYEVSGIFGTYAGSFAKPNETYKFEAEIFRV